MDVITSPHWEPTAGKIRFVDYRFQPTGRSGKWQPMLTRCIAAALEGNPSKKTFEFHTTLRQIDWARKYFENECKNVLAKKIPSGAELTFVLWRDFADEEARTASELLHARWILTDRGGYSLTEGLDESDPPGVLRQFVSLISEASRKETMAWYDWPESPVFDFVDSFTITGERSSSRR